MDLTFIEVMPMGDLGDEDRVGQYWSLNDLRARLAERYTLTDLAERTGGPARYVRLEETGQKIGFITPLTPQFLRKLQPGADDLHRRALTCASGRKTWPTCARPLRDHARTTRSLENAIRAAIALQAQGPRLRLFAPARRRPGLAPHEPHRRLNRFRPSLAARRESGRSRDPKSRSGR